MDPILARWGKRFGRKNAGQTSEAPATTPMPPGVRAGYTEPSAVSQPRTDSPIAPRAQRESSTSLSRNESAISPQPHHTPSSPSNSHLRGSVESPVDPDLPSPMPPQDEKTLWDKAYDLVREQSKTIYYTYERVLSRDLGYLERQMERTLPSPEDVEITIHPDFQKRRSQMEIILGGWVHARKEDTRKQLKLHDDNSVMTSFYEDIVAKSRERTSPAAVVVWVAACYASKELRHPSQDNQEACRGIIYVISRIEWFDRLQKLFTENEEDDSAYPEFLKRTTSLYAAILLYLMKVATLHPLEIEFNYDLQAPIFIKELSADSVKEAESALINFNEEQVGRPLQKLFQAALLGKSIVSTTARTQPEVLDDLLNTLGVAYTKSQHMTSSYLGEGEITKKIYDSLEKRDEYVKFLDGTAPQNRILWITGEHGQGKTRLLHGVAQALGKGSDSQEVASFFFNYSNPESDNAASALGYLIALIVTRNPTLEKHLNAKLNSTGRKRFNHPNDFLALSALFFDVILDPDFPKTYLIVDSLDECKYLRTGFIDLIVRSVSECNSIRWLVSSNSDPQDFGSGTPPWQHLPLVSHMRDPYTTIESYIKYTVSNLATAKSYDRELEMMITDSLCELKIVNYLWVDIVCGTLLSKEIWHAEGFVNRVKTRRDLQGLYSLLHDEINSQREDRDLCIDVLLTMGVAYQSLDLGELKRLMNWPPRVDIKVVLRQCSGFLQVCGDTALFRHESARAYVREHILDLPQTSKIHTKVTIHCLKSLGDNLGHDSIMPHGIIHDSQVAVPTIASSYASLYWMKHLSQISDVTRNTELLKEVRLFLGKCFLNWVDALSLADKTSLVLTRLWEAETLLQEMGRGSNNEGNDDLVDAIRDTRLFLRFHESTRSLNGVRAWNTAIFCPEASIIKGLGLSKVHPWLSKLPEMDRTWSPNFSTLHGHRDWVRSIAISSDDQIVASGSDDGTVRIWDTETGTTQHAFKVGQGSYVYHVALSAKTVAAGPDDRPVMLWDITTGHKIRQLPRYTMRASALCLSPNGRKVAVAVGRKVYVWAIKEELPSEPKVCDIRATALTFVHDDELLITTLDVIQLWNITSLEVRRRFTSQTGGFRCAALSCRNIGGTRVIASGSEEGAICIWEIDGNINFSGNISTPIAQPLDAEEEQGSSEKRSQLDGGEEKEIPTVTPLREFKSEKSITSISFSPNGSQLASTSTGIITIWESPTLRHLHTFQVPVPGLDSAVFAPPHGDYLVSNAHDGVHLWRANNSLGEAPSSTGQYSITGLAVHPNGKMLAGVRSDYKVFLWDLQNNTLIPRSMDFDHDDDLRSLAFSPNNGSKLLSTSDDGTARVCATETGKLLHILRGHTDWVRCAAWSPSEKYVATGSDDGSIRVWEVGGEEEPNPAAIIEEAHGGSYVTAVTFSTDGKYLVSGGTDSKVVIRRQVNSKEWKPEHKPLEGHTSTVSSILVTPDSKYVLSASRDDTLRKWSLENGEEQLPPVNIDWVDFKMWWDLSGIPNGGTPGYVMTPQGAWLHELPSTASEHQTMGQWRVRCDEKTNTWWITHKGRDVILIPRKYRPRSSLVLGNRVAIGTVSEHLYFLDLKEPVEGE